MNTGLSTLACRWDKDPINRRGKDVHVRHGHIRIYMGMGQNPNT